MSGATSSGNVAARMAEMAARTPRKLAVVCYPRGGGAPRCMTFAELNEASGRIAGGLKAMGIGRGARVALMAPPSPEFFALTYGLFKAGAIAVLADPGMGRRNLGRCLAEAAPEALIGIPLAHAASLALGWGRGSLRRRVTIGRRWFWGGATCASLVKQSSGAVEPIEAGPDETAAILYTSGATGVPKGAVYTHGIFAAQVEFLSRQFPAAGDDVDLATFPLFALFDPALGVTAVVPEMNASKPGEADPAKLMRAIEEQGVTRMFGSPALVDNLSRYGEAGGARLDRVRLVLTAGAPVRHDILERLRRMLPEGATIHTPYGATEALPVASIEAGEILGETRQATARGEGICVGCAIPGVEARIIRLTDDAIESWTDGLEVAPGEAGEIVARGPVVTREYWARPEATRRAKIAAGEGELWHRMGDAGRIDERGRLWFLGRVSHRVETAGGTLFPIACEGVFNQHPDVFRTALVGVGEAGRLNPALCVELERRGERAGEEALRRELLELGAAHELTRGIRTILFHPGFPVDARHNAKIDRPALARWAADRIER